MVFSETGTYLALVGRHGVCVLEMPQKRGKFTQFEHGKDSIICRFVSIYTIQDGDHMYRVKMSVVR